MMDEMADLTLGFAFDGDDCPWCGGDSWHCSCELRYAVQDMQLERDKDFGDRLMEHLEKEKKRGRAVKFLRRFR